MRRIPITALLLSVLVASGVFAGEGTVYGKGVTLDTAVPVGTLLSSPEAFVGKKVRVDGIVSAVCAMRGCWMTVTDPESGKGIRVKVEDGVIVFPMEAMGQKASAEGVFEVVNPVGEHAGQAEQAAHAQAAEGAGDATPHACGMQEKAAAKAAATYQIAGIGAIVY